MHRFLILALALICAIATDAAPVLVTPKHRAAPPEEMLLGGPLAPVSPADVPVWSRGAMMRVELDADGRWDGVLPVDGGGDLRIVPVSQARDDLVLTLDDGSGRGPIRLTPATESAGAQTVEIQGIGFFTGYDVRARQPGRWQASIDAPAGTGVAYLAFATESPAGLLSARVTDRTVVGRPIEFRASAHETRNGPVLRDVLMEMIVSTPDGRRVTIPMAANDGVVSSGFFTPDKTGEHRVQIVARGGSLLRTAQHTLGVVAEDVIVGGSALARMSGQGLTLRIDIGALDRGRLEHCRVTAQLWGTDGHGNAVPICWIGGMTMLQASADGEDSLPLDVDARWIGRAGASGPFELRHVEVRCPRSLALLSGSDAMPLRIDADVAGIANPGRILEEMRVARRSEDLGFVVDVDVPGINRVAGGHNLLLVHGYCADGNPWPPGNFSGAIEVFSDPEANRSHDQFALLLKALADTTKSSGVVAHSQGGCAALHLYTYYFSALDWAEGPRLIQSLGTPYQGTPLAGNLAALGDIFGNGCGESADLSVDGAAAWLSGIPNDARSRVYFWTTSASGAWCNFFSGLFLTNPEDGVVEVARGQLPGANSMGNTVGQCHTTGMSNPPQYQDASRNSEMNANAAR